MTEVEVGKKIGALRREKGLTQKELADLLYVSEQTVSKWERGKNFPNITLFEKIAGCLDTTVVDLLGIEGFVKQEALEEAYESFRREKKLERHKALLGKLKFASIALLILIVINIGTVLITKLYFHNSILLLRSIKDGYLVLVCSAVQYCFLPWIFFGVLAWKRLVKKECELLKNGESMPDLSDKQVKLISVFVFVFVILFAVKYMADTGPAQKFTNIKSQQEEWEAKYPVLSLEGFEAFGDVEITDSKIKEISTSKIPVGMEYKGAFSLYWDEEHSKRDWILIEIEYYEAESEKIAHKLATQLQTYDEIEAVSDNKSVENIKDQTISWNLDADYYDFYLIPNGCAKIIVIQDGNRVARIQYDPYLINSDEEETFTDEEWVMIFAEQFLNAAE